MTAPQAYIVDAVRTPVGKRGGSLAGVHPADLGAHVISAIVERTGIDPEIVDDVIFGCVDTVGPQAGNIARTAWLTAGMPLGVPGTTVDRQCGSSQQALGNRFIRLFQVDDTDNRRPARTNEITAQHIGKPVCAKIEPRKSDDKCNEHNAGDQSPPPDSTNLSDYQDGQKPIKNHTHGCVPTGEAEG